MEEEKDLVKNLAKGKLKQFAEKKALTMIAAFILPILPYITAMLIVMMLIFMIASGFDSNAQNMYTEEIVEENKEFQERVTAVYNDIKSEEGLEIDKAVLVSTILYDGNFDEVYYDEEKFEGLNEDDILDGSNEELLDKYKTSKRTLKKYAKKQINPETHSIDLDYYEQYLVNEGIDKLYPEIIDKENEFLSKKNIASEIMDLARLYYILFKESDECVSSGSCIYNVNGQNVSDVKVELVECGNKNSNPIKTVSLEDYVMGVVAAEVGVGADPEVIKTQAILAKSFALTRQKGMCPGTGGKNCALGYNEETNTVRMRACEAEQVYCDPTEDCYRKADRLYGQSISLYSPEINSSTSGAYVWKSKLSEEKLKEFKSVLEETRGKLALDEDGNIAKVNYASTQQKQFASLASQGYDYTEIILSVYPQVASFSQANCSAESSTGSISTESLNTIIKEGEKYFGLNYVFGANGPNKWDCSSFVKHLYGLIGVELPRTSQTQYDATRRVSVQEAKPGDLLFKDDSKTGSQIHHVAIYLGDSTIMHASSPTRGILKEKINLSSYDFAGRVGADIADDCGETALETGPFTEWRQYDPAWGSIPLGSSSVTIHSHGCLVTSVAIQLARSGINIPFGELNPGTLVKNGNKKSMFTSSGNYKWYVVSSMVPGFKYDSSSNKVISGMTQQKKASTVQSMMDSGCYVILEVKGETGQHWVAPTGTSSSEIIMIDPASDSTKVFAKYGNNASRANCYRAS